jgi:hypothetical protein
VFAIFYRVIVPIAVIILFVYALVDAISVPDDSMYQRGNKLIWILVILLAPLIGSVVYLLVGRPVQQRPQRRRQIPPDDVI